MSGAGLGAAGDGSSRPGMLAERLTSTLLIGRDAELSVLLEAAASTPAFVTIEGEAGIGKTRLMRELLNHDRLGRMSRLVGLCHELTDPFPLGPVLEALRNAKPDRSALTSVAGALHSLLPELNRVLPPALEPLDDKRADRHRLFRAVRELLAALGPSVLVLEDLHWADTATSELLRMLVADLPPELLVVCTYRGEEISGYSSVPGLAGRLPTGTSGAQVTLRPLDRDQVRELVRAILDAESVSAEFADYVFERTGGLPFAVEEMLLLLDQRRLLDRQGSVWLRRELADIGVPHDLSTAILTRLAGLSPPARHVTRAAAVLAAPGVAEAVLLDVAAGPDRGADSDPTRCDALTEALASGLLREVDPAWYAFRHLLARDVIEGAIPAPRRRQLHRQAAQVLETIDPQPFARLAHHYRVAGDASRWIHFAEAAADRAVSLEDDASAYRLCRDALSVPAIGAETRARLATKVATHALHSHEREAIDLLRRLLDDGSLPEHLRGEVRLGFARLLGDSGSSECWAVAARAVDELRDRPDLAAEAMSLLALSWVTDGQIDDHLVLLERAVAAAAAGAADPQVRKRVLADRAICLLDVGDPRAWDAIDEVRLSEGTRPEDAKRSIITASNLAVSAIQVGHYDQAREFLTLGGQIASPTPYIRGECVLAANALLLDWVTGDWHDLEHRALSFLDTMGDWPLSQADARAVQGLLLLASGDVHKALPLLVPPEDVPARTMLPTVTWMAAGRARVRLAEGSPDAAVAEADRGMEPILTKGAWLWAADVAPVYVEGLLGMGRIAEARRRVADYADGLTGREAPAGLAGLAVCRGLLAEADGNPGAAAEEYLAAASGWQALPRPYDSAQSRERAGRSILAADRDRGIMLLTEALENFKRLAADWDIARVRRTLRTQGIVITYRGGRKGYGDRLSPREQQVAELVVQGRTNREIATELVLSPRTVEQHVGSGMRKLGATSRSQIAELLPTHGGLEEHLS
jgi:DNA-binding CsgD family transcriptional regulator